jgi:hypothetical protein
MKIPIAKIFIRNIFLLSLIFLSGFFPTWERKPEQKLPKFKVKLSVESKKINFSIRKEKMSTHSLDALGKLRFYLSTEKEDSCEHFLLVSRDELYCCYIDELTILLLYKNREVAEISFSCFFQPPGTTYVFPLSEEIFDFKNLRLTPDEKIDEKFFTIEILSHGMIK